MKQDTPDMNLPDEASPDVLGHVQGWEGLALDYLEGRLGARERAYVDRHLASCPACRQQLDEQRWIAALASSVPQAAPPDYLEATVLQALAPAETATDADGSLTSDQTLARRRSSPSSPSWASRLRALFQPRNLAIAGAVVAVVVVGTITLRTQHTALQDVAQVRAVSATTTLGATVDTSSEQGDDGSAAGVSATSTPTLPPASATTTSTGVVTSTTGEPPLTSAGVTSTEPGTTSTVEGDSPTTTPRSLVATVPGAPQPLWVAFSFDDASLEATVTEFQAVTGLSPLPSDHWMGGPTFAAVALLADVTPLLDHLHARGFRAEASKQPSDVFGNALNLIMAGLTSYPVVSLSAGAMKTAYVSYTKLPPADHALLVFYAAR